MKYLISSLSDTKETINKASEKIIELGKGASVKDVFDILKEFELLPEQEDINEKIYSNQDCYILVSERMEEAEKRDNTGIRAWIILEFVKKGNPVCEFCNHVEYCKYFEKITDWYYALAEVPEDYKGTIQPSFSCKHREPCGKSYLTRMGEK